MDIVLVEPSRPGNIGAVARVMMNFGFKNLVLIKPKCNYKEYDARARAKHAKAILKNAKIEDFSYLEKYDYTIATTARLGGDYNIPRSPVTPEELSKILKKNKSTKVALVFGREDDGLTNDEIKSCDFTVSIKTDKKYAAMNLSHSVAILLYELSKDNDEKIGEKIKPLDKDKKNALLNLINETLDKTTFQTPHKRENQKVLWKKIIGKAMLTSREAMAVMGLFRKVK